VLPVPGVLAAGWSRGRLRRPVLPPGPEPPALSQPLPWPGPPPVPRPSGIARSEFGAAGVAGAAQAAHFK
jgi:hypothetical protein